MFGKTTELSQLDLEINKLHLELYAIDDRSTVKYATLCARLTELYAIKKNETSSGVSADVKATIAANLAGILIIVHHEKANVIASKALSFIMKSR